jgi:signal transduction histidine kinase
MNLLTVKQKLEDHDIVKKEIEATLDITKEAMQEVRRLSRELHPFILDHLGLVPTLEWFIEGFNNRTGMRVALKKDKSFPGLPKECEINLFRVVQETLTNSLKHGKVNEATVEIKKDVNVVLIVIEDNGIGFDVDDLYSKDILDRGIGIAGMRERINAIGGNFSISSKVGQGTTVRVELPLH